MALYEARKSESGEGFDVVNTETDEVVDVGLPEETAKSRAKAANEIAERVDKAE
jgi:hypothetical protein